MHLVKSKEGSSAVGEVLVLISGERGSEYTEAVAHSQGEAERYLKDRGVAKGRNPHFPDEYWGPGSGCSYEVGWSIVPAPMLD